MFKKIPLITTLLLVAAGACFALLPTTGTPSIHGSNEAIYMLTDEEGDEYFTDRLELDLNLHPFTIGVVALIYQPRLNPFSGIAEYQTDFSQIFLKYNAKPLKATIGSFTSTLAKGMVLRTYEDIDIDRNWMAKGAYLEMKPWKDLEIKVLGGRGEADDDSPDNLYGGEFTAYPLAALGIYGLSFSGAISSVGYTSPYLPTSDIRHYAGGGKFTTDFFTVSGIYAKKTDFFFQDTPVQSELRYGDGYYINAVATPPFTNLSVNFEYKNYNHLGGMDYIAPPYVSFFEQTVSNAQNEKGYLIEVISNPIKFLRLRGGYAHQEELTTFSPEIPKQVIDEAVASIRVQEFIPKTVLEVFYELEHEENVTDYDRGRIKTSYQLTDNHSIITSFEYERRRETFPVESTFRDLTGELSFSWSGLFIASLKHENTNQEPAGDERDSWTWGEFLYKLTNEHEISVGYGQLRGGKTCSGGVCRYELPFEGLRIRISSLF